jgi:hypothetical protein
MTHHHPFGRFVDRFQEFSFLPPCYPSYGASDYCSGGIHSPLNTPAFAGHTTGRAHLEHPAFRLVSPPHPQKYFCNECRATVPRSSFFRVPTQLAREHADKYAVCQTFVNDRSVAPSQAHQKQGPFPPPALPGFSGIMALSESRRGHHPIGDVRGATPPAPGLPQLRRSLFLHAVLTTPADQTGACIGFFPVCAAFPD